MVQSIRESRRERRLGKKPTPGNPTYHELSVTRKHRYPRFAGPGSATKFIVQERWNPSMCGGCFKTARKMDEKGVAWCRENLDQLAQEMHENVEEQRGLKKGGWVAFGEFLAYATMGLHFHRQLLNEGINLYETTSADALKSQPERKTDGSQPAR